MNILELCLSPDLGGLELYMERSALALATSNRVLPVVDGAGRLRPRLEKAGLAPHCLARRCKALPLLAARQLAALIDREAVDLVHIHWGKDLPLAALAKRLSRRSPRLVYTRQMQITRPKRDPYHEFLYRQVDRIITITEELAGDMRRFLNPAYAGRVTTLYYGVKAPAVALDEVGRQALRRELGVPEGAFLVGLIGRIKHFKGQHLLVEAVGRARAQGQPMAALIVGRTMETDYLEGLKARCREQGIGEWVVFKNFVDNPQALMQACDCVLLASVEETFGLVLVEAMRAGVAVVGSDRGGVPEIIDHGQTGLLFRSGDAGSLYEQLDSLRADPALRARLAAAGREKADCLFNEQSHYQRLRELFEEVVRENAR